MSGGPEARGVPPHCPPAPSYGNTSAAPGGTRRSKRGGNGAEAIGARDRHARAPSPSRASPQHLCSSLAAAPSPAPCLNTRAKEFGGGAGEDARAVIRRRVGWRRRARGHRWPSVPSCDHGTRADALTRAARPCISTVSRLAHAPRSCPSSHLARPVATLAPAGPVAHRKYTRPAPLSAARESFAAIRAAAVGRRA